HVIASLYPKPFIEFGCYFRRVRPAEYDPQWRHVRCASGRENVIGPAGALSEVVFSRNAQDTELKANGQWAGPESNRRHMDFQSIALPAELPARRAARRRF